MEFPEACTNSTAAMLHFTRASWSSCSDAVVGLRRKVAPDLGLRDDADEMAEHFLAMRDGQLVAALRNTFASKAPLDLEDILPLPVPAGVRSELVSVSRFLSSPEEGRRISSLLTQLIFHAWDYSWKEGSRAALVTAPEQLLPLYRRAIGIEPISKARFHPRTGRLVRLAKHIPRKGGPRLIDRVAEIPGRQISPSTVEWLTALEQADA